MAMAMAIDPAVSGMQTAATMATMATMATRTAAQGSSVPDDLTAQSGKADSGVTDAGLATATDASVSRGEPSRGARASAGSQAGNSGAAASTQAGGSPTDHGLDTDRDDTACEPDLDSAHLPKPVHLDGSLGISDPDIIQYESRFYAYGTGVGIPVKTSTDMRTWRDAGTVFPRQPAWIARRIEGVEDLWSPDVSFFGGVYHLYYAASKQGSERSCIGHATAASPTGPFADTGAVLCSNVDADKDDWNAIHPNHVRDAQGNGYLAFGSFWSGIKLVALNEAGDAVSGAQIALAERPTQGRAIEAPFIVHRCGYYYLFVSFDRCCDGVNSTYKVFVGRAQELAGPYVDRDGRAMLEGGGTLLIAGDDTWHGPGHSAVFASMGRWYEAHHAYYAGAARSSFQTGQPYLRISELAWDADGWPAAGGP